MKKYSIVLAMIAGFGVNTMHPASKIYIHKCPVIKIKNNYDGPVQIKNNVNNDVLYIKEGSSLRLKCKPKQLSNFKVTLNRSEGQVQDRMARPTYTVLQTKKASSDKSITLTVRDIMNNQSLKKDLFTVSYSGPSRTKNPAPTVQPRSAQKVINTSVISDYGDTNIACQPWKPKR